MKTPPHTLDQWIRLVRQPQPLLLWLLCVVGSFPNVTADPILFTFNGVGDGLLGDARFSNSQFSIRVAADTADIKSVAAGLEIFDVKALASSITLSGIGSGSFQRDQRIFVNHAVNTLGFSYWPNTTDLLNIHHPSLGSYALEASFGPISDGTPFIEQFKRVPTSLGSLSLMDVKDVTFSAIVIPEPSPVILLSIGAAAVLSWRRLFK